MSYGATTIKVHLKEAKDHLAALPRTLRGATVSVDPKYVATIRIAGFTDQREAAAADIRAGIANAGITEIADEPKPIAHGKVVRARRAGHIDAPRARVSACIECGDPTTRGRMLCDACA